MITPLQKKRPLKTQKTWQDEMRDAVTCPKELWSILNLPLKDLKGAQKACTLFPLKVPRGFIQRMQSGDLDDPLLRQILPLDAETISDPNFTKDPVADLSNNPVSGIVHKYHGRVLLIATGACGVHCRYCFRRHFPYHEQSASKNQWQEAIDYIQSDDSIHEVILSGGDPLSLSNNKLQQIFSALESIAHVKTIRIHTRQIVVLPSRVDEGFLNLLSNTAKNTVIVLHVNHANEIDQTVAAATEKLSELNIHLLNQAVLLKGVNDNQEQLIELSHALFAIGVLPYYLNVLDQVSGAGHFEVPINICRKLHTAIKARLPGYLVPKLVQDLAKKDSKTWLL